VCVCVSIAGVASALISEDEPEDVRPSDDAILATATARHTSVADHNNTAAAGAATASVDKRRRQSAPSDAAALLDNRRRHPVLPRTLLTHTTLCLVLNKNFASINTTTV